MALGLIAPLFQLCRFLVKSVTFTTNVRVVRLYVNGQLLLLVNTKAPESPSKEQLQTTEIIDVPAFSRKDIINRQNAGLGYMTIG